MELNQLALEADYPFAALGFPTPTHHHLSFFLLSLSLSSVEIELHPNRLEFLKNQFQVSLASSFIAVQRTKEYQKPKRPISITNSVEWVVGDSRV
jgi:hypothetical protein